MRSSFLLVFFFIFCISCSAPADYSKIKIQEVIDGDTVRLANGELLRYIGLDTPEINIKKDGRFIYDPQPFALEAKKQNRRLTEGKTVRLEFDVEKKDRYGRLLGYCFVDEVFVNAELIKQGLAALYTFPPNVKYADLFVKLQRQAREEKRGFWGKQDIVSSDQAHEYINQVRTVRGKVLSAYQSPKCVFLNFSQDYKTDFTVVIFNNSLGSFRARDINPMTFYEGKIIEITGRIKEYNGPEIIANSPDEIEVIDSP